MKQFSVKFSGLDKAIREEKQYEVLLRNMESDIRSVKDSTGFRIQSSANLSRVMTRLADDVGDYETAMRNLHTALQDIRNEYRRTEDLICGRSGKYPVTEEQIWEALTTVGEGIAQSVLWGGTSPLKWTAKLLPKYEFSNKIKSSIKYNLLEGIDIYRYKKDFELSVTYYDEEEASKGVRLTKDEEEESKGVKLTKDEEEESKGVKLTKDEEEESKGVKLTKDEEEESKGVKLTKDEEEESKGVKLTKDEEEEDKSKPNKGLKPKDITLISDTVSFRENLIGGEVSTEGALGNAYASGEVRVGEVWANAGLTAAGAEASIGIAVTALTGKAGGQLGNDMLGLHGNVQVDVGKADASAELAATVFDSEGNFKPQLGGSLRAEALLAEASGTVGVDVLGTDVNVKGSVNFGIGAHAEVGLIDNKIKVDVGASLGVGASVQLEIDMTGTIEMVADVAQNIGEVSEQVANAVTESIQNASEFVDNTADVINNAVDSVGDFVGDVGDSLEEGWATVTSWFE